MTSRRELFPRDAGLTARMIAATVATPLAVLAGLVGVVALAPTRLAVIVGVAAVIGVLMAVGERRQAPQGGAPAPPDVQAAVERLCMAGELPMPDVRIEHEAQPNSWIVWRGRERFTLHLTQGLLDRLEPKELEAVIAHELAHVAHRDAAVMTVVGGPGAILLNGGRKVMRGWLPMMAGGALAMAVGWVGSLGGRILSRYREFAADAGAVALTGNPAALASALTKVSEGLVAIPSRDLRAVAARDAFHLLPVARNGHGDYGLPATHPPLRARIDRLQRMEAGLQAARPAPRL